MHSASFADPRLVICLCERNHLFYEPQPADEYYQVVKRLIGAERTALLQRLQDDRSPHRRYATDWLPDEIALLGALRSILLRAYL